MSPMFIKEFKYQHPCCRENPVSGKRFCVDHLSAARDAWYVWSHDRQDRGVCSFCDRRATKASPVRCRTHREENRRRCSAWQVIYGKDHAKRQATRREALIAAGLCGSCKPHRPLRDGFRNCLHCRQRNVARRKGDEVTLRRLQAEDLAFVEQRAKRRVKEILTTRPELRGQKTYFSQGIKGAVL